MFGTFPDRSNQTSWIMEKHTSYHSNDILVCQHTWLVMFFTSSSYP